MLPLRSRDRGVERPAPEQEDSPMIAMTDTAIEKFQEAAKAEGREGHGLRVIVRNGGTYQPEFALNFVAPDEVGEDDTTVDAGGVKLYVDPESAKWLEGASIDFIDGLQGSGFKVDAPNAGLPQPTGPLADAVNKALEERVNPMIASHGGSVSLVAVEEGTVYLRFGGGCQGCGMVKATLKQGVEKVLFEEVPGLEKVMDITDHASGTNPYYRSAE
jgi:Fe/S biogenesis protein NfuA